ncbi:sigma-70 family RNA polymerase sigma factor [Streptomyces sp. NPDC000410]|uniref:sigma-70 family RNA polymerase sigma factor n=1 Tax=Streptomyces sp. NPDC000410 TaxID=3154254 RepID=UPI003325972D
MLSTLTTPLRNAAPLPTAASTQAPPCKGTARPTASEAQIRAVIAENGPALRRFTLSLVNGDSTRAEELYQETLIRAWQHPEAIAASASYSSFRPWLFTVSRRIAIDCERARRARPQESDENAALELISDGADAFERILNVQAVREALMALGPDHRDVLVCLYYKGLSGQDAAKELGVPLGTVKSRAHYAVKMMEQLLAQNGYVQ